MHTPDKTIAVINASGRQAASLIRVATVLGYTIRAQLRDLESVLATEVSTNPNVKCLVGDLYTRHRPTKENSDVSRNGHLSGIGINHELITELFRGAHLAFINTTYYGDEVAIGKALADAAKKAGIQHYIYSSMPDHTLYNPAWPSLPLWSNKYMVEQHIRDIGLPATFVYTGIYNNNFTSLPYPLFCMELQPDGSFVWQAPFHPDAKLPWLDAEHDVGPAVYQIFKEGPAKWNRRRIALAYEMLTPRELCALFSKGVGRPVKYVRGPIEIRVPIPEGYRDQLQMLEKLFTLGKDDPKKQPPYFGDPEIEGGCPSQVMLLWEAPRGIEEYAREIFPLEEYANGMRWMGEDSDDESNPEDEVQDGAGGDLHERYDNDDGDDGEYSDDDNDEGLVMKKPAGAQGLVRLP
ncbi:related to nitrogen metabolic regulation protein nmr [Cephalotrichum gorgonifer]|uniref:Related to nitrogen metabolic regulation protein nmr n=1 Tax=Cephalotrichum gorgonifer TaxID=2041049 RepID=A0AAE8STM1_9PEZI|nr:related to nitrogen metabolic regulation protein nmr [Cephalotrichum gorgonifer]